MIYAIAIDDEQKALDIIENYCSKLSNVHLLKTFTDPFEGLEYIQKHSSINTVFLDIKMPKITGIELTKKMPANLSIILTTAYSDYSLMAFEFDATDYLLKPFSFERFNRAITKARLIMKGYDKLNETSKKLVPSSIDVILVKCDHKNVAVRLNELMYVEAARNYIILHTLKGKILALNTLKSIENILVPYQFVRVHKSFIASFQYVDSFGKNKITIKNTDIPIGESYREAIQDFLGVHSTQI